VAKTTPASRSRAHRLRNLSRRPLTDEERAWLIEYDAIVASNKRAPSLPAVSDDTPQARLDRAIADARQPAQASQPSSAEVPIAPWSGSSIAPVEARDDASHASSCSIKDCPACAKKRGEGDAGVQICAATGDRVYPPMSDVGARLLAGAILAMVGIAIRMLRADRQLVAPTAKETADFGLAIREVARRRASWMGAYDDLTALVGTGAVYMRRAATEPAKGAPDAK
jgi:hypothetical protein